VERLAMDKRSSLSQKFQSYGCKNFYNIGRWSPAISELTFLGQGHTSRNFFVALLTLLCDKLDRFTLESEYFRIYRLELLIRFK